ncbi:uncharacterized protein LOC128341784 isoform X2 [Hemicordylus capensis]|uniref:uncharacterized protein LOC128341784 isoform X2 n=1 Tax=Hemicordylus capensis TaxID=884348 RepID=UPI0023047D98|nr:uncharacterized protein LOC128341784 isoform X2 [Hemicordylus capensis]
MVTGAFLAPFGDMRQILSLLLFVALSCAAKPKRQQATSEWDYRSEAEKVNLKGCANLTVVLDNWKFAIMTQIKNLLLYDHQTVLPDYGRIKPLSDALDDLYKEFNALKERLGELTTRFEGVESFVDEMNKGQNQPPARTPVRVTQPEAEKAAVPLPPKRRRVLGRNGRKPTELLTDGAQ